MRPYTFVLHSHDDEGPTFTRSQSGLYSLQVDRPKQP